MKDFTAIDGTAVFLILALCALPTYVCLQAGLWGYLLIEIPMAWAIWGMRGGRGGLDGESIDGGHGE